jgi:thiamine pyrophosphate-dependent acetolactate synthase large subunit-like protein
MITFVGQVGTEMRGREAFQELDYRALFGSMAQWVVEIDRVERNPDFVSLARCYGFHAERVATTEEFAAAFDRATHSHTCALLDLDVSPEAITTRQTLTHMHVAALASKAQG